MSYLLDRKKNNQKTIKIIIILIIVFSLSFIFRLDVLLSKTAHSIATPIWQTKIFLGEKIQSYSFFITSKKNLLKENNQLKGELFVFKGDLIQKEALLAENLALKEALSRVVKKTSILAVVLAKPNRSPYDTMVLDIGENAGVIKGDLVEAFEGVIIGKIEEVFSGSSKVRLFSSAGVKTEVIIGEENIYTTATGLGGGNFTTSLPRGVAIEEGDYILLPNINSQVLGIVGKIIANPEDSFQRILFKLPLNLSQLKWVKIIKDYQSGDTSYYKSFNSFLGSEILKPQVLAFHSPYVANKKNDLN